MEDGGLGRGMPLTSTVCCGTAPVPAGSRCCFTSAGWTLSSALAGRCRSSSSLAGRRSGGTAVWPWSRGKVDEGAEGRRLPAPWRPHSLPTAAAEAIASLPGR